MRSEVPDGDLAAVIEAAVTLKLERLEARRFAATKTLRKEPSKPMSPQVVRAEAASPEAASPRVARSEAVSPKPVGREAVSREAVSREAVSREPVSAQVPSSEVRRRLSSRYIPAAVRRVVWTRDGGQCAYLDAQGRRCSQRARLEFHHRRPFDMGGDHGPENIALLCRVHNDYIAEHDYGREHVEAWRSRRRSAEAEARS